MTVASHDRVRHDLVDVLHHASDLHDFSLRATRAIAHSVGFDGVCMVSLDPATGLPTGEISKNAALSADVKLRLAQIEIDADDVNAFGALGRSPLPASSLNEATGGDLSRSRRHRELRAPNGFGDELRTTLVSAGVAWGGLTLLRADDRGPFTTADVDLMGSLSQCLAEGLRRATLLAALRDPHHADEGGAGLVLLTDDDSVVMTDAAGKAWLAQIEFDVVAAVAGRARTTVRDDARLARARVRSAAGAWLVVRGSALSGEGDARTAITIEPAGAHDLSPLIAEAYGLTDRERDITQFVAQGLPTKTIAGRLCISPWTVQDHLKSVFEKVGVRTRGELVSRVFLEHFAPRLAEPDDGHAVEGHGARVPRRG